MRAHGNASRSTRRASRSQAAVTPSPPARLRWARLVVAAALAAGLLLAPRLFLATRVYPRVPVLDGWPLLSAPLDVVVLSALLAALCGVALAPRPRWWAVAATVLALVLPVRDHARRARGRARYRRHTCRLARGARRALPLERHPEAQRHLHDTPLPLAGGAPRRCAAGRAAANFVSRLDGGPGDGDHGGRGPARAAPPKCRGGR